MKYLCLIYDEEAKMANMSEADGNGAARIPSARSGSIEVRPVEVFN